MPPDPPSYARHCTAEAACLIRAHNMPRRTVNGRARHRVCRDYISIGMFRTLIRAVDKFLFWGASLAAKSSPAGCAAPGIAREVWGHAPLENFEILGSRLKCILRQVETIVKCLQLRLLI